MSWRDRDWAKLNDDERRRFFGASSYDLAPPAGPRSRVRRRFQRSLELVLVFALVVGTTVYVATHWSHTSSGGAVGTLRPAFPIVNGADAKDIPIRWSSTDLAPAQNAGRICVTDARHGKICASYVVGERPADTLTREIERRGLHVQNH
jgi:hypothetical protein